jgi:lactoylglutathione lyase
MSQQPIEVLAIAHVGVRVHDLERSVRFYEQLGFRKTAGPIGPEPVAILHNEAGIEINLILNAPSAEAPNILMDVPDKHAGITHIALLVRDLETVQRQLAAAGIPLSGGPIDFSPKARGLFVRDPDRNVIELHERLGAAVTT